jgi:hypothetical protein
MDNTFILPYQNYIYIWLLLIPCMFNIMLQIYQHMHFFLLKINSSLKCLNIGHILNVLGIIVDSDTLSSYIGALVPGLFCALSLLVLFDGFYYCSLSSECLYTRVVVVLPCTPY